MIPPAPYEPGNKPRNKPGNKHEKEQTTMSQRTSPTNPIRPDRRGLVQRYEHLTGPGPLKWTLPSAILLLGIIACAILIFTKGAPPQSERERLAPLHRVQRVQAETILLTVTTNGTVAPRTQSDLVPEVSGTVNWVSPSLVSGGFFEEGEVLLQIDPRDY
jgi:hypothetical protein